MRGLPKVCPRLGTRLCFPMLICVAAVTLPACSERLETPEVTEKDRTAAKVAATRQDLLIGYGLLADTLEDESKLRWLELVKKLTLAGPSDEVADFLEKIAKSAKADAKQLDELREEAPDVTAKPDQPSVIGDAITEDAKKRGARELLDRHAAFNVRFLLLQAQAMRMIAVIAAETANLDSNRHRKVWLDQISDKYEGYRDDLVMMFQRHCSDEVINPSLKRD